MNFHRNIITVLFELILMASFSLVAATPVHAATVTSTAAGGNWATGSTWVGGSVPATGDAVIIATTGAGAVQIAANLTQTAAGSVTVNGGATLNATINGVSVSLGALTVNSGGTVTMYRNLTVQGATSISGTINFGSTSASARNMTFTGAVTLNSGAVWNETTSGAAATFSFGNSFTNNATSFIAQDTAHNFTGATRTISGTTATIIPTVTFTGNYTNSGTLTVGTLLTVTGGAIRLTNNGTITASTALSGTGGVTQGATGTLNIGGSSGITTLTATDVGNTVNYTGAAQTAKVTTYHNLTLSGSGTKTFATTPTVNGKLSLEGTAIVSVTTGVVTYGTAATLQYNTVTARTASSEEWITPFAATGGVIIANAGPITVNSAKVFNNNVPLTINSGATFNTSAANNYQLTFGGNFFNNGGTFTANSSPIVIGTGTATQSIAGFTTTGIVSMTKTGGTATFTGNVTGGAFTLNGSGGTLDLGAGLAHTFTGAWTRTAGTLLGNSSTLNIGGTTTYTAGTFTAGTSTVNYNGSIAQAIANVTYNNLTISNPAGITLNGSPTVSGTLTLNSGIVTTGANTIIIGPSGSVSGGSSSSYIFGNLQKYVATGAASRTFEVGATHYNPVTVVFNNVSTGGSLTAKATSGQHINIGTSLINSSKDVNVYWSLTNSGVSFDSCSLTLYFVSGDIIGGANPINFKVGRYSSGWTYPSTGTKTATSTQATGITSFSDFVLGESTTSNIATVTSATYAISAGGTASETITNVPFGTSKAAFLLALIKGEINQTWNDAGIAATVVTGNNLVVTAQDGTTVVTYTVTVALNSAKAITGFTIPLQVGTTTINEGAHTVAVTMPYGTVVTGLVPAITHTGASVNPASGLAQDFTGPVTYTVTAADATTQAYTVTVTVALNSAKAITGFTIPLQVGTTTINEGAHTVAVTMPYGTVVTGLVPAITHTGASVNPASGLAQDFTGPVTYTVTAADATTQAYTVTVTVALNSAKAITGFTIPSQVGTTTINEGAHTVAVTMPYGTVVTGLVPAITHTGASVSPASGLAQDFTGPVTYTVTAADATTQAYTVTVTVALNSAKAITGFTIPSQVGTTTINEGAHTVAVTMPYGTVVTGLVPAITHTGASVNPASGLAQDFTGPVTYTVTAADATTQAYTVTVAATSYIIHENLSPVFSTLIPDQAYVVKDNVNYKLYYAGNDFASINLAQSSDGVTWTPYSGNPIIVDAQYHSDVKYYSTGFVGANSGIDPSALVMNYRMWYQGLDGHSISGWRYAESQDGIQWFNRIPITQYGPLVFSSLTGVNYGIADVIYTPGASNTGTDWTFRIYANVQWEAGPHAARELVVMAFSSNGYAWTGYDPTSVGYATPVFGGTLDGVTFDTDHIGWFKVIKNSPTDWQAFYSGGKDTTYQALNGIGYATSTDGISWTRRQTLLTTADGVAWRSQSVWMPSVVKTGDNYELYFLGSNNTDIGSSDWIQWKLGRALLTQDSIAPTVNSTLPTNVATAVAVNSAMNATFSEAMNPLTITTATFTLQQGSTSVLGVVTYSGITASFTPSVNLAPSTVYTATITTGVKDLAGNAMASPYMWSFTTGQNPAPPQAAVSSPNNAVVPVFSANVLGQTSMRAMNSAGTLTNPMIASSKDGSLTIELARGTKILRNGMRVLTIEAKQTDPPPTSEGLVVIVAYEFGPGGTVFNPAPRVTIKYDANKLPANTLGVALARYNDISKSWEELPAEGVASIGGPVNGRVDHFSTIGVVAKLAPPEKTVVANPNGLYPKFTISELMISPAVIRAGEAAKIQVSVANEGNEKGIYPLTLRLDGKQIVSREITLAPGQEIVTSFYIKDIAPGKHIIEVGESIGSFVMDDGFNSFRAFGTQILQLLKMQ